MGWEMKIETLNGNKKSCLSKWKHKGIIKVKILDFEQNYPRSDCQKFHNSMATFTVLRKLCNNDNLHYGKCLHLIK